MMHMMELRSIHGTYAHGALLHRHDACVSLGHMSVAINVKTTYELQLSAAIHVANMSSAASYS
jgi:hypothetical protein